jgi:hypothetical protein
MFENLEEQHRIKRSRGEREGLDLSLDPSEVGMVPPSPIEIGGVPLEAYNASRRCESSRAEAKRASRVENSPLIRAEHTPSTSPSAQGHEVSSPPGRCTGG